MCQLEQRFSDVVNRLEELHRSLPSLQTEEDSMIIEVGAIWIRVYNALQILSHELSMDSQRPQALRVTLSFFEAWRNTRASKLTQFTIQEFAGLIVIVQVVSSERDLAPDEADELESNLQRVYLCPNIAFGERVIAQA